MKTKLQQIADMGMNTDSITRAITHAKEKYFDNDQMFFEDQINQLTGIRPAFSSLLEAQYTFLYVIQTIILIHQNKEDRMTDNELVEFSINKANEHLVRFELTDPKPRKEPEVIIKEREVVAKKTGELKYIDKAYNIVMSNKDKPKSVIVAIIMEQLNVKKGTAHVYMSKIKRGAK